MNAFSILIVDDEVSICESLKLKINRLSHDPPYEVMSCLNAFEALRLIKEHHFDLIITDIRMPFMSGLSLVSQLRKDGFSGTIFALSGYDDYSYVRDAFISGVDDYLLKPISIQTLGKKLLELRKNGVPKTGSEETAGEEKKAKSTIDYACEYIAEHFRNSGLSMDEVARYVHLSYSHFSSMFREETGMTFPAYLRAYRIKQSLEYLADPSIRIADVALTVGFKYPQQFSNDFKRVMGMYPSEYVASQQNQ